MGENWDAVFIGSGISALTCGAFLAKAGLRVRVLEQHTRIGGYAHSFTRKPFRFESGIHSVPMGQNGYIFTLLKALGVDQEIETVSHNCMYSAGIGDKRFIVPSEPSQIREWFFSTFPADRADLQALFDDMAHLYDEVVGPLLQFEPKGNETNPSILSKYLDHNYRSYIESYIKNPELRDLFFAQWPFAGVTPESASTTFFTLLFYVHAVEGTHYIKGGFERLADVLASVITAHGGKVTTSCTVTSLHCENGLVHHAELDSEETICGKHFISNASPRNLVEHLINKKDTNRLWVRRSNQLVCASSAVAVYLGLDSCISSQLPENILFWYKNNDFRKMHERIENNDHSISDHLIVLKTPEASPEPTLFLMKFANNCSGYDWKANKERVALSLIDTAEHILPGLSKHIRCTVTASPQTFERYTLNSEGSLYGFANNANRYSEAKIPMQTFIPNLYQTGHWCRGGGVWNVMESGFTVSKQILKNV